MVDVEKARYNNSPDGKLCSNIERKFQRCADMRQPFERQWYLNIAFYFGRQWVGWVGLPNLGKFTLQDFSAARKWEVRVTANKVQPSIRKELTKLTKEEPQYYVNPNSAEEDDLAAARAAELIADHQLDVGGFNKSRSDSTWWSLVCGTGYLYTYPDGKSVEMGKIDPENIITKNTNTYNIYVPNLELPDIEDQPYVYHVTTTSASEVFSMYGVKIESETLPESADYRKRLMQMMGVSRTDQNDGVLVKELFVKPNAEFPEGAYIVTANHRLLYINEKLKEVVDPETDIKVFARTKEVSEEELAFHKINNNSLGYKECEYPFPHKQYPFAKIDHIPSGRYYGLSAIEGLIPLQKEYNRARSQIRMSANLTSSAQWAVEEGSISDLRKLTNRPGEVILYRPGTRAPEPVKQPEYPQYAIQDQDRILKDMDDFTIQYEVSHGRTPPGVEAASAIAYLQEENDSVLHHTSQSIENATTKVGYQTLRLIQDLWSENHIIKVTSRNNIDDVRAFKVADMKGHTDFRVEPGSMAPKSRAAKQALILELMKGGYIKPEDGLQYLNMVETNRMWQDLQIDSRQVQRENMRMKRGTPVPLNSYDNHALHVLYHERWMKTQDFEVLDEATRQQVEVHVQEHKMKLAEQQISQQLGGSPPNVGTGNEPAGEQPQQPVGFAGV